MNKRRSLVNLVVLSFILLLLFIPAAIAAPPWKQTKSGTSGSATGTTSGTTTEKTVIINNTIIQQPVSGGDNVSFWSNWAQILGGILAVAAAVVGWYLSRRIRGKTATYMTEIDKVYREHNKNANKCEAHLADIREKIEEDFKKGKINDQSFSLLESRMDKYAQQLRSDIVSKRFELPEEMKKDVKHMLSDGIITKEEYDHFIEISTKSSMTSKDKQELQQLMKKWKEEDKR